MTVREFSYMLLNGVSMGAMLGIVAMALVIIYRGSHVVNFAFPSLTMLAAFAVIVTADRLQVPFIVAVLIGVVIMAVGFGLLERVLIRRLVLRRAVMSASILTLGLDIAIRAELNQGIGSRHLTLDGPWGTRVLSVGDGSLPVSRVIGLVVAVVLMIGFRLWLKRSSFGIVMRAVADDQVAANEIGVRVSRIWTVSWVLAGALTVPAAVFLVAFPASGLDTATYWVALTAIPVMIIGGLQSLEGAVVAGVAVGVCMSVLGAYQDQLAFLGRGFDSLSPYVLMLLVLLVKPGGLISGAEVNRV